MFATRLFFLSFFSCNFSDQSSQNFHYFVILCIFRDTPSKNTGLWQLTNVSSAFSCFVVQNPRQRICFFFVSSTSHDISCFLWEILNIAQLVECHHVNTEVAYSSLAQVQLFFIKPKTIKGNFMERFAVTPCNDYLCYRKLFHIVFPPCKVSNFT